MLRSISVALLVLTVAIGFAGPQEAASNLGVSLFWIGFSLAFAYLSAIVGGLYELANPWLSLCDLTLGWSQFKKIISRVRWAWRAGYWPAVALFYLYIWFELFGHLKPRMLAWVLVGYSAMNFMGAAIFGREAWFKYGECFAIYFRNFSKIAPLSLARDARGTLEITLRRPFVPLVRELAETQSLVIFVLFTLSATAFDGAHETLIWVQFFWRHVFLGFESGLKVLTARPYLYAPAIYYGWQWAVLAVSPFAYYALYRLVISLTKILSNSTTSAGQLSLAFALSLVPIAFAYNVTHYFALLLTQGVQAWGMISDPLGRGWNVFGTARLIGKVYIPDISIVWHAQVLLILAGHIVGVYLSHLEAERLFAQNHRVAVSQMPMLIFMIALTIAGLWLLSLPIVTGQVFIPITPPR
jgi:hypothetical protein